jgi:2-polyprenyl-3-methyl-5-hydroxy-6-metoxy-1,4-benzoquinol methylase
MTSTKKFEEFSGKYTKTGHVGRFLVKNFYGAVASLIKNTDLRGGIALEVGAGQGYSTNYLRNALNANVALFASEVEPEQVRLAQIRNKNVPICIESVYEMQREHKSVDLLIMLEVLEHLEDPELALSEIARVTKHFVILSVPQEPLWRILNFVRGKYWTSFGNTPGHINHWSAKEFHHFTRKHFEVVEARTPLPWTILLLKPKD